MSKQSQMTNFFKRLPNTSTPTNQNSNKRNLDTTDENNKPPLKKVKILKYNNSYIEYGFTSLNENGTDVPQSFICSMTLANASLKQNNLIRYLETNHVQYKNKTSDFFLRKLEEFKKNKKNDKHLYC